MKNKIIRSKVLSLIICLVLAFYSINLAYSVEDADTSGDTPSDISDETGSISSIGSGEDDFTDDADTEGDEAELNQETDDSEADDADGELEEAMSLADERDADSEEEYQAPVESAIPVDLSDPVADIGETEASLSIVVKKSDEQQMTGYTLKLTQSTDGTSAEGAAELQDEGYLRYNLTADTSELLPGYAMTPDTEYEYVFSVTVDGESYSKTGSFRTAAAAEQPVKVLYGDVNDNGKIGIEDVQLLCSYLQEFDYDTNSSPVKINTEAADCSANGKIGIEDVQLLCSYLQEFDYDAGSSPVKLGKQ